MADLLPTLLPHLALCLPAGARVAVAVSGGPDSQALLDLLARARARLGLAALHAVGVDHGLRPAAAAELDLALRLAALHALPAARLRVAVPRRGNLMAEARRARYRALRGYMRAHGLELLALGHHADDQAETVLQRLARGCGLRGAAGMRPRRGALVRPLLGVGRAAIAAHVATRGLACAHDPSNADPRRSRARLRATVMPALAALNARSAAHLAAFAADARCDDAYLRARARRLEARLRGRHGELPCAELQRLPAALAPRVVQRWLAGHALAASRAQLAALARLAAAGPGEGAALSLGGRVLRAAQGALWVDARAASYEVALPRRGSVPLPGHGGLRCSTAAAAAAGGGDFAAGAAHSVAFDADRLHFALAVRPWRAGDRLRPFGGVGHIHVGDLFTNAKVPRAMRPSWPVVVHGHEIAWVVGLRRGDVAPVVASTRRVIRLKVEAACPPRAC